MNLIDLMALLWECMIYLLLAAQIKLDYGDSKVVNNLLDLMNRKHIDTIKTKYCEDNNIKLIRIPYWEFDNIENILIKELNLK